MNGKRLEELRIKSGYSRTEVAKEIYVTESYIQAWEEGWAFEKPSSREIEGMAELFGMDENCFRGEIDHFEEDDSDYENEDGRPNDVRFVDIFDSVVKIAKRLKDEK